MAEQTILYAKRTAFYIAHTFTSLKQLNEEQMGPNLTAARDFLKNFICVDARALPHDARSIHYVRPEGSSKLQEPTFKTEGDGAGRNDGQLLKKANWLRGDALLDALVSGTIGRSVNLADPGSLDQPHAGLASENAGKYSDEVAPSDIGLYVRLPWKRTHEAGG